MIHTRYNTVVHSSDFKSSVVKKETGLDVRVYAKNDGLAIHT